MKRTLSMGVVAAWLSWALPCAAQAPPSCAATEDASTLFRAGQDHYAAGHFAQAYVCYRKQWQLRPGYDVAANLGNLEVAKLKKYAAGAAHLFYARAHIPDSMEAKPRERLLTLVNKRLAEAKTHIATVQLTASPRGAAVAVDGALVGSAPLSAPLFLSPGAHQLRVSLAAHVPHEQPLRAQAGTEQTMEIALVPGEATSKLPTGTDGTPSPGPGTPSSGADGTGADGTGADGTGTGGTGTGVTGADGGMSALFWAGLGIAGAGLVTGGVAGGIALSRGSDIQDRCPDAQCDIADTALAADHDSALLSAHVSTVGFAVAGAGAALALIDLFLTDDGPVTGGPVTDGAVTGGPVTGVHLFSTPTGLGVTF